MLSCIIFLVEKLEILLVSWPWQAGRGNVQNVHGCHRTCLSSAVHVH